jgi:hypothetical protein
VYYTIKFPNGREKQTETNRLNQSVEVDAYRQGYDDEETFGQGIEDEETVTNRLNQIDEQDIYRQGFDEEQIYGQRIEDEDIHAYIEDTGIAPSPSNKRQRVSYTREQCRFLRDKYNSLRKENLVADNESIWEEITTSFNNAYPNCFSCTEKSIEDKKKSIKRKIQSGGL